MITSRGRTAITFGALATSLAGALLLGCSSEDGIRPGGDYGGTGMMGSNGSNGANGSQSSNGSTGSGGNGSTTGATSGSGNVNGSGGTDSTPLPDGTDPAALLPARVRRLSNAEYDTSVAALLDTEEAPAQSFAPDARQAGFTVNDAQRVDAVLVKQLFSAAERLAAEQRTRFGELAPCDTPDAAETCAAAFIDAFGARAYRRPLVAEEAQGLLEVFRTGAEDATYEDGIELVIRAVLQSAGFLYLTELGEGAPDENGAVSLTAYELASSLSYLVTAAPPDQALIDAALSGKLASAEGRGEELVRLREAAKPESDTRLIRLIREWIGVDRIETTAKDSNIYEEFDGLKNAMIAESYDFVQAVLDQSNGNVRDFLGANWTVTSDSALLGLYQAESGQGGMATLPERRGILNQGAFLSVYAHAHESTPVLRGVAVARRMACLDIPSPASLNITVVPPIPDPSLTTRERFEAHTSDPECEQCHKAIDPFGNTFEQFDGMGKYRETENGRPVDSTSNIDLGTDIDGDYSDSNQLAQALAESATVRSCFARYVFRAAAARSDSTVADAEDQFIAEVEALPVDQQGNLIDALLTYVSGPLFTHRRAL